MSDTALLQAVGVGFSWAEACEALGVPGRERGRTPELHGVCTDTRSLEPGALFFALRGPRFDGHDYLSEAMHRGAAGVVVDSTVDLSAEVPTSAVLGVDDPQAALGRLGAYLRSRWNGHLVAVTGSCGKTTTKEILGRVLGDPEDVLVSPGTENNAIGVPRVLAGLQPSHRFAVVEMGTSSPGEIAYLTELAEPDVAVITGVGAAHLEGLTDLDGVAREKAAILEGGGADRIAVLNGDDPHVRALGALAQGMSGLQCIYFGLGAGCDVRAASIECGGMGMRFKIDGRRVRLPMLGVHNVRNALAAYAVARELGVTPAEVGERLEALAPIAQRLEPFRALDALIIDDTYNANPPSMRAALHVLQQVDEPGRRILVAGDMKELGLGAEVLHREIGKAASDSGIDVLWAVGPLATFYLEGAREAGARCDMEWFPNTASAADALPHVLQPGDVVLVKGSRSMGLEAVTQVVRERAVHDVR